MRVVTFAFGHARCSLVAPAVSCRATLCGVQKQLGIMQRREYTPPSRRTWSKQHHRVRIPRPLVDRFNIAYEHPEKEWWRERRVAPATFFGFPDVSKHAVRGGSLYIEQMDAVTLAVISDKCVKDHVKDEQIWNQLCWRAQQLASRTHEPDLCYIFRAFARKDWLDENLLTTYLGRLHRRLQAFQLPDVVVLLEAFANPRFRLGSYLNKALTHLTLLLQHRDDAEAEDLARACSALRSLRPLSVEHNAEVLGALELLAEALLIRDLSEMGTGRIINVIDCFVAWGLVGPKATGASVDLCWSLVRELRGQLRAHGRERPDDLAALASALADGHLVHAELWTELTHNLQHEAHRLTGPSCAAAAFGTAKAQQGSTVLFENLARRLAECQNDLAPIDCARAAAGFLRLRLGKHLVLKGPVAERILELGIDAFDDEALVMLLRALSHAPEAAWGVEVLAGASLEVLHARLDRLSPEALASVVRSLAFLTPSDVVLRAFLDAGQQAALTNGLSPKHTAMLLQGIAAQSPECEAHSRLESLLPLFLASVDEAPAVTLAQMLQSLTSCKDSPARHEALSACTGRLAQDARELSARRLIALSETLAALVAQKWTATAPLIQEVAYQLDMKRYDLPPGILWRAEQALRACCSDTPVLRLELRDQPI